MQVFTNSDKSHAEEALHRLGLQGCFDGVICFETLNPCNGSSQSQNCMLLKDETSANLVDLNESDGFRPKSPILCKPSVEAMKAAIRIANVDPKKTVRISLKHDQGHEQECPSRNLPSVYFFQIFFDDSTRNIASGKAAGFHTVIVRRRTWPRFHIDHRSCSNGEKLDLQNFSEFLQVGRSILVPGADHALESIHNIKEALPEIWDGQDRSESDAVLTSSSVGTAVVA